MEASVNLAAIAAVRMKPPASFPAAERVSSFQCAAVKQRKTGGIALPLPQNPPVAESDIGFLPTEQIPCGAEHDTVENKALLDLDEEIRQALQEMDRVADKIDPGILEVGTIFAGQYIIESLLGRGGMGAVYLASKIDKPEEKVAIKVSLEREIKETKIGDTEAEDTETTMGQDLRQEEIVYRLLAGTGSRLFPEFYGAGLTEQGQYYVAMEYVAGRSLHACLKGKEKLPLYRVVKLAMQLCGLQVLHEKGFVYRDLKPENIQIREESDEAVVLDFGLAEKANKPQPKDLFKGTPAYASPEQARVEAQDQRADIYAFGIMLYEMITGNNPMAEKSNKATLIGQATKPMPDLPFSEFESRLDTKRQDERGAQIKKMYLSLKYLIQNTTAKNKKERIGSLEQVMQVLQPIYAIAKTLAGEENLQKQQAA